MTAQQKISHVERQSRSAQIGTILLYGTFGLLMFGPLAFGAVEPWSIFIVELGALALTLLWLYKQWIDGAIDIVWNPFFPPMAAFGVLIFVQLGFGLSAYRHDTISQAMLYCAYAMLCFLATQSLVRSSQARKIAVIMAIYGFSLAAFALIQGVAPNGKLYWIRQPRMGGWIYGSYVNHNHYSGLMELLIPIPLVIAISHFAEQKERLAAGIAASIMVGTVFLSGSRGGMLAILVELVVFAVVVFRRAAWSSNCPRRRRFRDLCCRPAYLAGWKRSFFPRGQHLDRSSQRNLRRHAALHRSRRPPDVPP